MYISPPAAGKWYGTGDDLPDGGQSVKVMGSWNNRYCVVPTSYDLFEQMKLEGDPTVVFDAIELREMEAAWALSRMLALGFWQGTGGKQPDGVAYAIEKRAPGSQTATITGIDKSSKRWYNNQYVQLKNNFGYIAPGSRIPAGILAFLELQSKTRIGQMAASDFITTEAIFKTFQRAMMEMASLNVMMTTVNDAELGFEAFRINGSQIGWDSYCPDDSIYALSIDENRQSRYMGDKRNKTLMDTFLEQNPKTRYMDMKCGIGIARHPKIDNRAIEANVNSRNMISSKWIITSFNPVFDKLSNQGVAGSDNGQRWSTWN
jgi:hypothetical protein